MFDVTHIHKIVCFIFGHNLRRLFALTYLLDVSVCDRCGRKFSQVNKGSRSFRMPVPLAKVIGGDYFITDEEVDAVKTVDDCKRLYDIAHERMRFRLQ